MLARLKHYMSRKPQKTAPKSLPTVERANGDREWHNTDGQRHRKGGLPTFERANGDREWHNTVAQRHREDGLPTVERANGDREWHNTDGQRHRNNGLPAVERRTGNHEWWINGIKIQEGPSNIPVQNELAIATCPQVADMLRSLVVIIDFGILLFVICWLFSKF